MTKKNKKQKTKKDIKKKIFFIERMKRLAIVLFLILSPAYVLFAAFLYFNQANFFYYPDGQDFDKCHGFNEYQRVRTGGTRMYYKENSKDDVIVYYHGNAGSACDRTHVEKIFDKTGKSLVFVEYAGYAGDHRVPSKELIFRDVRNAAMFVKSKGFENVTVVGESIGTGPASYHTKVCEVDKLLLLAPFGKIEDVAKHRFPIFPISIMIKEDYDNIEALKGYKGEVLLIFGTEDKVIPAKFSEELCETLDVEHKRHLSIFGAEHTNLFSYIETIEGIEEFIK